MFGYARNHPLLCYYALVFAISWGAILIVVGPAGFLSTTSSSATFVLAGLSSLLGPSVAGLLMTAVVAGRAGFRDVLARLRRWRVGIGWYAVALLTAPLVNAAVLFTLSLTSSDFRPAIVTSDDRLSLLLFGITVGLFIAFCEELGWTGFATPRFLLRHGVFASGLVMGVVWGVWHLPLFAGSAADSGLVGSVLMVAALLFAWLPPYRMLMVWVYDNTQSLLVVILMHMVIVAGQYVFNIENVSPEGRFTSVVAFGAGLWLVVGAVALMSQGHMGLPRRARLASEGGQVS
jgi:membrane protease YdiL (CAAX protease family)